MRQFLGAALLALMLSGAALADSVPPSSFIVATGTTTAANPLLGGTVVSTVTETFTSSPEVGVTISGSITSQVIVNSSGNLVFTFQITNDASSTENMTGVLLHGFFPFSPDAGFFSDSSGTVAAELIGLGADASSALTFLFQPTNQLQPGDTSMVHYILTNAEYFGGGSAQLDFTLGVGYTATPSFAGIPQFPPETNPVPEPATLALVGSGFAGVWLRRRKK